MKLSVRFDSVKGSQVFYNVKNVETKTDHVVVYMKNYKKVIWYDEFSKITIQKE